MRRNVRRYITRIAQSISSEYMRGFFIVVCSLCNSLLVYFPDDAQQHLKEVRRAIVRLTQSISMGNEYIRNIDCSPCNHAYSVVFRMRRNARRYITRIAQSISSQYLRGFLLLFVRFVTRCWFISR